jgi:hypothetical protein
LSWFRTKYSYLVLKVKRNGYSLCVMMLDFCQTQLIHVLLVLPERAHLDRLLNVLAVLVDDIHLEEWNVLNVLQANLGMKLHSPPALAVLMDFLRQLDRFTQAIVLLVVRERTA